MRYVQGDRKDPAKGIQFANCRFVSVVWLAVAVVRHVVPHLEEIKEADLLV